MSFPAYNASDFSAHLLGVATRLRRRREIISSTLRQIELLAAMKSQAQRAIYLRYTAGGMSFTPPPPPAPVQPTLGLVIDIVA